MRTYRIFLFLLTVITLFASCSEPKDRVRIKGEIAGIRQANFFVYNEEGMLSGVDTVHIINGQFKYERLLKKPALLTLLYPNYSRTYVIAEPGKKLKIKGEASKLSGLDVSGSKENELLTKFKLQNLKKSNKDILMAAAQFVRDHSQTMAAVAVFKQYFVQAEKHNAAVALPLLEELKKAQPQNPIIQIFEDRIQHEMQTAEGNLLPDFTAKTIKGDTITRNDFKGKPLLIVFWAPWNKNSYQIMKSVSQIENKHLGKLQVLTVSVDYAKSLTKIRLRQDNITSPAVCEERGFDSPLVKTLGVRYVPGNLFVNAEGEIIKRDVPIDNLVNEVKDWMK